MEDDTPTAPQRPTCLECVRRKVRCDREDPCGACRRGERECVFPAWSAAKGPKKPRTVHSYGSPSGSVAVSADEHVASASPGLSGVVSRVKRTRKTGTSLPTVSTSGTVDPPITEDPEASLIDEDVAPPTVLPVSSKKRQTPKRKAEGSEDEILRKLVSEAKRLRESGVPFDPFAPEAEIRDEHELERDVDDVLEDAPPPPVHVGREESSLPQQSYREPTLLHLQVFLENVHPLTRVVHGPSLRAMFNHSSQHDDNNALKFSVCACALASITDRRCQSIFGGQRLVSLSAFQALTQQALTASSVKDHGLQLFQAHLLHLTSMMDVADHETLWFQLGSILRLAQLQGLHRDGVIFDLSPFDIEMRRRAWWYFVTLDARLAELTTQESILPSADTKLPSNNNDADLTPGMTSLMPRYGASDMTFCLIVYEITQFLRKNMNSLRRCHPGSVQYIKEEEELGILDLEALLKEKYTRYCDPVVPVEFLADLVARSLICKIKQMIHHKRDRRPATDELNMASHNLQYDNLIDSSTQLRGFLWHTHFFFSWGAPLFVLKQLTSQPDWNEDMNVAWTRIKELYAAHPEFLTEDKDLHRVLANATLEAWSTQRLSLPIPSIIPELLFARNRWNAASSGEGNDLEEGPLSEDFDFTSLDFMVPGTSWPDAQPADRYDEQVQQGWNLGRCVTM